jgi:folate-dependent phosphoribosylglycinamide formyltransferase PurN/GNAT superfamily N-acetyltransferase
VSATATRGAVNLLARLDDPRFLQRTVHLALEGWDRKGVYIERFHHTPEDILAWIDAEFGGTWSSEAHAGSVWLARDAEGPAGFAAFDPRGLRFSWLRAWRDRPEVGVFGPFGVAERARGTGVGHTLLHAALFALRERGYLEALIPSVSGDRLIAYYERETGAQVVESLDLVQSSRRWRVTVMASGNGTNFQSVVDAVQACALPIEVAALVCNHADALVLERAARAGVPAHIVAWDRKATSRAEYDDALLRTVAETSPDLLLLLGWMHVLRPSFVERFPDALNIHPAFLPIDPERDTVTMPDGTVIPAIRGARAVDEMFAAGIEWGGASVHRLGLRVDRGEVMARAPLRRAPNEPQGAYLERLHALEHRVLSTAIRRWTYEQAS